MKSSQQRKTEAPEAEKETAEAERPVWFLGKELKVKPVAKSTDGKPDAAGAKTKTKTKTEEADAKKAGKPEKSAKADQPEEESDERRPSQLEAYMRYAKMRRPASDEEESLAPVKAKRFPAKRHAASNENESGWSGEAPPPRPPRPQASYGFRARDAVLAGIASIAIGALAGAVVYDRANNGELSAAVFDSVGGYMTGFGSRDKPVADAGKAGDSVVEEQNAAAALKKPVTTARLDVSDAKGDVNSPIPLNISAEPAIPNQDIAFRLSGLPADAYLTAGTKLADNAWILKPGEQLGVKLMVPSVPKTPLLIAVEAIEPRTGDLAAPSEEMKVALATPAAAQPAPPAVLPVSAPPTDVKRNFNLPPATQQETAAAQPIPAPLENDGNAPVADSDSLMRNGDKLLGLGDFTAARAFFSKARELGNHEASLRLGQTYDPLVYREKNVQGLKPDPSMALKYYLEARTAGIADAETAIAGLETWMKQ